MLIAISFYQDKFIIGICFKSLNFCPFRNSSRGTSEAAVPYHPASPASSSRSGSRYTRSGLSPGSASRSGSRQESSIVRPRSRSRSRLDYLIIFLFTNSQNYFPVPGYLIQTKLLHPPRDYTLLRMPGSNSGLLQSLYWHLELPGSRPHLWGCIFLFIY